jgi:hypothetical protein
MPLRTAPATCALLLGVLVGASSAHALNDLALDPLLVTVAGPGLTAQLALELSFDDTTVGGGVTLSFDSTILSLVSISFDGALGDDADFRCPTQNLPGSVTCPAVPNFISFGDFGGIAGDRGVATVTFLALMQGVTPIDILPERPFGDDQGSALDVSYSSATVEVLPEPGNMALVGSLGLAGLVARSRRARRRAGPTPALD